MRLWRENLAVLSISGRLAVKRWSRIEYALKLIHSSAESCAFISNVAKINEWIDPGPTMSNSEVS